MPFDPALFDQQVTDEEHLLALVLKGHLWLEACLNRALEVSLPDPGRLNLERDSFARKVALAASMCAIPRESDVFLLALNRLRNELAHKLDREVIVADLEKMRASMRGPLGETYNGLSDALRGDGTVGGDLKVVFMYMVMAIEHHTMLHEWEKRYATELGTYRLVLALRERLAENGASEKAHDDDALIASYRPPDPPTPEKVWIGYPPLDYSRDHRQADTVSPGSDAS